MIVVVQRPCVCLVIGLPMTGRSCVRHGNSICQANGVGAKTGPPRKHSRSTFPAIGHWLAACLVLPAGRRHRFFDLWSNRTTANGADLSNV